MRSLRGVPAHRQGTEPDTGLLRLYNSSEASIAREMLCEVNVDIVSMKKEK